MNCKKKKIKDIKCNFYIMYLCNYMYITTLLAVSFNTDN